MVDARGRAKAVQFNFVQPLRPLQDVVACGRLAGAHEASEAHLQ
jgi:hypothetical protein